MSKVIMFSRVFPAYHPKAGEPTNFVEKIAKVEKIHTIRKGHRFKVGDTFSPRVWGNDINPKSGRSGPYNSKQIIIAPDMEVKQIYSFELQKGDFNYYLNGKLLKIDQLKEVAKNDGLHIDDFECWFNSADFDGQIICWSDAVKY